MLPILFKIGPVEFYTLGLFLVIAFFFGGFVLWRLINLTIYKDSEAFDVLLFCLFGASIFSRIVFILLNPSKFGLDILKMTLVNGYPGLSLIGALFGGYFFLFIYCQYRKKSFLELVDYYTVPLLLVLAIGKIGSFFAGLDVGIKTNMILSARVLGYQGSRHIVAIYESLLYFIGFAACYRMIFKIRREQLKQGTIFFYFLLFFSLVNLTVDNLKENHLYLAGFSFNFLISWILGLVSIIYFIANYRNNIKNKFSKLLNKKK